MSYGQDLTKRFISLYISEVPIEDYRPAWLSGLEIDLYYPHAKLAIEFQGDHHVLDKAQKKRDRQKKKICLGLGLSFAEIFAVDLEYQWILHLLKRARHKNRGNHLYLPEMRDVDRDLGRHLNKLAIDYRKTLIRGYDSPSARRSGNTRLACVQRHYSEELKSLGGAFA